MNKKHKKPTKLQELEARVLALENNEEKTLAEWMAFANRKEKEITIERGGDLYTKIVISPYGHFEHNPKNSSFKLSAEDLLSKDWTKTTNEQ